MSEQEEKYGYYYCDFCKMDHADWMGCPHGAPYTPEAVKLANITVDKDDTWEHDLKTWIEERVKNVPDAISVLKHYYQDKPIKSGLTLSTAIFYRLHELGFLEGLRQVSQNMITWHDPEKEPPPEGQIILLLLKKPDGTLDWEPGYYEENTFLTAWSEDLKKEEVVKWGSFDLPELSEVKE